MVRFLAALCAAALLAAPVVAAPDKIKSEDIGKFPENRPPNLGPEPFKIDIDLAEAVFRNAFEQLGKWEGVSTYCIGYASDAADDSDAQDPAPEFVSRFTDVTPAVKPYSACTPPLRSSPKDKATGAPALLVTIGSVKCSSDTACEVTAGYFAAALAAAGWTCYLEKRDGKWTVKEVIDDWIS